MTKKYCIFITALFCAFLAFFSVAGAVMPDREQAVMALAPMSMAMPQVAWEMASTVFLILNSALTKRLR